MGLFTNRKHEGADTGMVDASQITHPLFDDIDTLDAGDVQRADAADATFNFFDNSRASGTYGSAEAAGPPLPDVELPEAAPTEGVVPDIAQPFYDNDTNRHEATPFAGFATTFENTESKTSPALERVLQDRLPDTPQTDNVDINVDGLLELLGVDADASLADISEARRRFLTEHDPSRETNEDAAQIKERIRREVNTAYASFRLTRGA